MMGRPEIPSISGLIAKHFTSPSLSVCGLVLPDPLLLASYAAQMTALRLEPSGYKVSPLLLLGWTISQIFFKMSLSPKSEKIMRRWFLLNLHNLWVPGNESMRRSCQDKCPGLSVDKCIAGSLPKDRNHIVVHKASSGRGRGLYPPHQSRMVFWLYTAQYPGRETGRRISVSDYPP